MSKKQRHEFCVQVDSRLDEEATREVLDRVINYGLAAAAAQDDDLWMESEPALKAALDMDFHSPAKKFSR